MRIHIIQKDETLTTIAEEYEIREEAIIKNNPQLADPDYIVPGMKLRIPQPSKKVTYKQDQTTTETNQGAKAKKEKRKKNTQESEVYHQTSRPINESLHDDGHRKQAPSTGGRRMFHPASRPFSSIKHKQVIHSQPVTNKPDPSVNQEQSAQKGVEKKYIYCDCCHRPIYFE